MNYGELKRNIADVVKPNGNQEITGQIMQDALFALVENLGEGWQFGGAVHPSDEPSLGADVRAFYLAVEKGTYADFGGVEVTELTAIMYDDQWYILPLGVAFGKDTEAEIDALAGRVDALEADGSVTTARIADGAVTSDKIADDAVTKEKLSQDLQDNLGTKAYIITYGASKADTDAIIKVFEGDANKSTLYVNTDNMLLPAEIKKDTITTTTTTKVVDSNEINAFRYVYARNSGSWYTQTFRNITADGVSYGVQGRSDAEKAQARRNIGALSSADGAVGTANIADKAVTTEKIADNAVTSAKLAVGARNPIILTESTTEVDEETYQKLLRDDADVVFNGVECLGHTKNNNDIILIFGYSHFVTESGSSDGSIISYTVMISGTSPHKIQIAIGTVRPVLDSTLTPVLQEIDLTGTDTERKAKLDQFEKDWKALTGASDLSGARFVGYIEYGEDSARYNGLMTYCSNRDNFFGGTFRADVTPYMIDIYVSFNDGSLTITPLFSHLEAITIYTDNTDEHKQANLDNIAAYEANLQALGVDTTKSPMIPFIESTTGYQGFVQRTSDGFWIGSYFYSETTTNYQTIKITEVGEVYLTEYASLEEVENKVSKSLNAKSLEAITIYTDNTEEHMQANLDNIAAYVANLQALGVDTTKGYMIPIELDINYQGFIMGKDATMPHTGIVKRNIYNYTVGSILIADDGSYTYMEFLTVGTYNSLTTTLKKIVPAINEVNTKATGLASSLEAITIKTGNTTEDKAANVAAIKAYVDNLKALGVDVTKGYSVPIIMNNAYGIVTYGGEPTTYEGVGITRTSAYLQSTRIQKDGTATGLLVLDAVTNYSSLTTTSKQIVGAINEVNALAKGVKALGAIEIKAAAADKAANKTAIDAYLKILTDAGIDTANGYSVPVRITGNSQEYFGTLNIGTGTLLSGVVTDINESHHYPCNVNISDGELTFSETNYFLEKTSNEVTEMLDAIKYSYTPVAFTETTLSNKAQLEVFLSKVPDAQVMNCTYKGIYAGTLHKINGDWFGLLVKNTNDYADNLNVKLQADGTLIEGTTSVQSINAQLDAINGEVK